MFKFVVKGTAFTSINQKEVEVLENSLFCITEAGTIAKIIRPDEENYMETIQEYSAKKKLEELPADQYILPGFVDLHIHAPQWAQAGTALDLPLYDWLNTYTFPLEAKFSDKEFANEVYSDLVSQLLKNGTTTALYFATVHRESSVRLAEICSEKGQRGLVGKVVMDDPEQTPDYYRDEKAETAIADTEEFIKEVLALNTKTPQGVYPVVTPRFIPSCTDEALAGLGALAAKYDVHIQSHCSESDWAHGFVFERFGKNDAFALNDFGLLGEKAIMAHAGFLSDADMGLFAEKGTAVAHCPISNAYFGNAVTPVAKLLNEYQVEVGLGSDISGGFSPSLFDNIKQAVISSRMLEDGVDKDCCSEKRGVTGSRLTLNEAFYLATAGGGESLSLPIGKLAVGFAWDVQFVTTKELPIFTKSEPLLDIFQKIVYLSHPESIQKVWVQGRKVYDKESEKRKEEN
ncbi:guanine deaminase [Enterococcus termitis]|uniref:Guanine deaminase n=1 Tax=Enterococcus termitis TaxID=332950 RepID=A0A1E5GZ98_9ENTE|nr:guanine deaminase [Enterococcus termitis]OEG18003.1 guanine deaminase [Enterococcus termitis]OJG97090.1 guanine deaminase [Enterococcus termitis]